MNSPYLDPRELPSAADLIDQVKRSITTASSLRVFERMAEAHKKYACEFPGKTGTGRKEGTDDKPAFPWNGAPDTDQRLIAEIVQEFTDIGMAAFERANLTIAPRSIADPSAENADRAGIWKAVLAYHLECMEDELPDEVGRFIHIACKYGRAVLAPSWHETRKLDERQLDPAQVLQIFMQEAINIVSAEMFPSGPFNPETGNPSLTADELKLVTAEAAKRVDTLFADPDKRPELLQSLMVLDPDMTEAEAKRVAKDLKRGQPATYYVPITDEQRPKFRALIPWVHVFYPPETTDISKTPWVGEVEWLHLTELEARAVEEGWDKEWVEAVKNTGGQKFDMGNAPSWVFAGWGVGIGIQDEIVDATPEAKTHLFQILTLHHKATSPSGVPGLYRTVLHGNVTDKVALHEHCPYAAGSMPYVGLKLGDEEVFDLNEGIPELAGSVQQEIKFQRDARGSQVQLRASPPLQEPVGQGAGEAQIKPGIRLFMRRAAAAGGEYKFLQIPPIGSESLEFETATKNALDAFFFRGPNVDPEIKLIRRQRWANRVLSAIKKAYRFTFQLVQQYTDDIEASTIAGVPVKLQVTREEIQGKFALQMDFDVGDLNLEATTKKMEMLTTMLIPLDRNGIVQTNTLIRYMARKLMPEIAERIVGKDDEMQQKHIDDEENAIAKMAAGLEPAFKPGQNAALRLQIMQDSVAKSPRLAEMLQSDEMFAAVYQNRMKQYQFELDQQQNAVIGRTGGKPVLTGEAA